jgi:hypothetical protein
MQPTGAAVPFNYKRIALPDRPAAVSMLDVLPSELAAIFATPCVLIDVIPRAQQQSARCFHSVPQQQYLQLLRRLLALNMVRMHFNGPDMSPVGLFAVPKGEDALRLIADARPGNARRVGGWQFDVRLPSPEDFAALRVPPGVRLLRAKHDILAMFHQLLTPLWMQRLFALPELSPYQLLSLGLDPRGPTVPCLSTLPMGFTDSVLLAQAIVENLMAPVIPRQRFLHNRPDINEAPVLSIYIDDIIPLALETHKTAFLELDAHIEAALDAARLPSNTAKRVRPTLDDMDAMGCTLRTSAQGAVLSPSVKRKAQLYATTLSVLRRGTCTGEEMNRLLGLWAWSFLLCRSAFSIFHAAYRFVHTAHSRTFRLWGSVRRELLTALATLPYLVAPLTLQPAPRIYAVDASHWGGALVSTPRVRLSKAVTPWRLHWGRQWQRLEHINALEMRAATSVLLRHAHSDIPLLSDSTVAIGVLRKGRSSSWHLNTIARRFHYLQLASASRLVLRHIPSANNPADAHSRGLRPWSVTKFAWMSVPQTFDVP